MSKQKADMTDQEVEERVQCVKRMIARQKGRKRHLTHLSYASRVLLGAMKVLNQEIPIPPIRGTLSHLTKVAQVFRKANIAANQVAVFFGDTNRFDIEENGPDVWERKVRVRRLGDKEVHRLSVEETLTRLPNTKTLTLLISTMRAALLPRLDLADLDAERNPADRDAICDFALERHNIYWKQPMFYGLKGTIIDIYYRSSKVPSSKDPNKEDPSSKKPAVYLLVDLNA